MTKQEILDALRQADITSVSIHYDGQGDSGCVTEISHEPPQPRLKINKPELWKKLERYCYDVLEQKSPGWEINEGSVGSLDINVDDGTIVLNHGYRIEEVQHQTFTIKE